MNKTDDMTVFKRRIYVRTVILALVCELISLPIIGWNPKFAYGLALGTCITIVNFEINEFFAKKTLEKGTAKYTFTGYIVRLIIYTFVFLKAYQVGKISGLGVLIGFLTIKAVIYYLYGFKPGMKKSQADKDKLKDLDDEQSDDDCYTDSCYAGNRYTLKGAWRDIFGSSSSDKKEEAAIDREGGSKRYKRRNIKRY